MIPCRFESCRGLRQSSALVAELVDAERDLRIRTIPEKLSVEVRRGESISIENFSWRWFKSDRGLQTI